MGINIRCYIKPIALNVTSGNADFGARSSAFDYTERSAICFRPLFISAYVRCVLVTLSGDHFLIRKLQQYDISVIHGSCNTGVQVRFCRMRVFDAVAKSSDNAADKASATQSTGCGLLNSYNIIIIIITK